MQLRGYPLGRSVGTSVQHQAYRARRLRLQLLERQDKRPDAALDVGLLVVRRNDHPYRLDPR